MLMEFSDFAQPKRNEFGALTFQLEAKLSTDIFRFKNRKKFRNFETTADAKFSFERKKKLERHPKIYLQRKKE